MLERTHNNPRRPPADKSVSLLHSPRAQLRSQPAQARNSDESVPSAKAVEKRGNKSDGNSPSSLHAVAGKHSSGESSNAEKWFERSNNEVSDATKAFADNCSPFFLRNSSSSEEQPDRTALQQLSPNDVASSLQLRTGLLQLGTDASSTEDFRGVIDDLTIENKKLKRRLKKYERLHDSHLKDEKLFEVRVHGLPPDKKRELEETLRKFATDLNYGRTRAEFPANGNSTLPATLATHKTSSSAASLQNTDSAYASWSASGRGSAGSDRKNRKVAQMSRSRHQNIHTYLHHIPEGLLPQSSPESMSERAKKKLVVRRLEQIFTGKGAAAGGHQQALQQQDVSHSAARADRIEQEAQGQQYNKEGVREASIMESQKEFRARSNDAVISQSSKGPANPSEGTTNHRVLEQRPTRPLDLDPHRAQVPADNMRYIRHLGFLMPDLDGRSPADDQGWIYLNLLVSMAQLHTISVTSDFVRKAIGEFSQHLEISNDGRKVRWKGGSSVTRTSSDGGTSSIDRNGDSSQSPRKRVKLGEHATDLRRTSRYIPGLRPQESESTRFAYTPLFFHKDSTSDEDSSSEMEEDDNDSSPFPPPVGGDSSGMTSSGIRTASGVRTASTKNKKAKHDDGPIIFYNNARFCTDLSGDSRPAISPGAPLYRATDVVPIGGANTEARESYFETRGPLAESSLLPEAMNVVDDPQSEALELNFPVPSPSSSKVSPAVPIDFEVSGIGGVYPADHFAISVESRNVVVPREQHLPESSEHSKVIPPRIAKLLGKHRHSSTVASVSSSRQYTARRKEMAPSALPPALSYMLTESDSLSDDGSGADVAMSLSPESLGGIPSLAAPQRMDLLYNDHDENDAAMQGYDETADDASSSASDDSLDLLATARELDPEAVRAREREYDANMAERLAEEIPTGSSAATAGGGSGFASPASGVSRALYLRAKQEAMAHKANLSRRETTDSLMATQPDSSPSEERGAL